MTLELFPRPVIFWGRSSYTRGSRRRVGCQSSQGDKPASLWLSEMTSQSYRVECYVNAGMFRTGHGRSSKHFLSRRQVGSAPGEGSYTWSVFAISRDGHKRCLRHFCLPNRTCGRIENISGEKRVVRCVIEIKRREGK